MDANSEKVVNYRGPGRYRHYKGGEYYVLGLALQEETVRKEGEATRICDICGREYGPKEPASSVCPEADRVVFGCRVVSNKPRHREMIFVVYKPLTPGSMLEDRDEEFWARRLSVFNEQVRIPHGQGSAPGVVGEPGNTFVPRFTFIGSEVS